MQGSAAEMRRWQDWASFALGLWLAVSPWFADYAGHDAATTNAAVCGLALALTAHFGFSCDHLSCEWLDLGGGLWLAVSPWFADYAGHDAATTNAAVCGLALALTAHFGFSCDHLSTEWVNLAGGLWLVVAPFVLGFEANHVAAVNAIAVGAFVTLLSAWALQLDRELGRIWHRLNAGH